MAIELEKHPASLAERLRPHVWEDVLGCADGVRYLRLQASLAKDGAAPQMGGRSVMIVGPKGVGKTTIARLYGQAIHCSATGGDPCGACGDCAEWRRSRHINSRVLNGAFGGPTFAQDVRAEIASEYLGNGRLVVLIDEGQFLKADQWSQLHDQVEQRSDRATFIVCVANKADVPERHRALFQPIVLRDLQHDERVALLTRAAQQERIQIRDDLVQLIARLGGGDARALLNALEGLTRDDSLTEASVRAHFEDAHLAVGLAYLERVLSRESLSRQISVLDEGGLATVDVARTVRRTLAGVLSCGVLGLSEEQLPPEFAPARDRIDLAQQVLARGANRELRPRRWLQLLIDEWRMDVEERSLLIDRVNAFDELLNGPGGRPLELPGASPAGSIRALRTEEELRDLKNTVAATGRRRSPTGPNQHLNPAEVERLWDAASFLVQVHGCFLNRRLSICWGPGERKDEAELVATITDFQHQMGQLLVRHARKATDDDRAVAHFLRVSDRDEQDRRWTHWALAVPKGADLERWVNKYRRRQEKFGVRFHELRWSAKHSGPDNVAGHLENVRELLVGIDPAWQERVADPMKGPIVAPVAQFLGLSRLRPLGVSFVADRVFVSRYLDWKHRGLPLQVRVAGQLMGRMPDAVSIFQSKALWAAGSGWEINERDFRVRVAREFEDVALKFRRTWGDGSLTDQEEYNVGMQELLQYWVRRLSVLVAARPSYQKLDAR